MITAELLATLPLFAPLPDETRAVIAERAADIELLPEDWLAHEGEAPAFFVVLEGSLDVLKDVAGREHLVARFNAGDYFGELPILLGTIQLASLRARGPVRVMRLEPDDFLELVIPQPQLSRKLLQTMAKRVALLQHTAVAEKPNRVKIIGPRWLRDCFTLRDFLSRNQVPFEWLMAEDLADDALIPQDVLEADRFPVVVFPDGSHVVDPSLRELAERVGLQTEPRAASYDLAIIGAGPSGLAAAVYGASEGLRTIIVESEAPGGQAGTSSRIENYLGFPAGLSGTELSHRALAQARRFGAEMLVTRDVTGLDLQPDTFRVLLAGTEPIACRAVIIATGVTWRHLNVPGIDQLVGRGVYYGASRAEAQAIQGQDIYLVGGGNSAGQAAVYFSSYARTVTLLIRGDSLAASMSQYLIDQLGAKENISIRVHTEVAEVQGDQHLTSIALRDNQHDTTETIGTEALFLLIGAIADTGWLPGAVTRDAGGYILTGREALRAPEAATHWPLKRDPLLLETSVPGIFAAGDVRSGSIKRVASATGEGSMAVAFVHQYLADVAERRKQDSQRSAS